MKGKLSNGRISVELGGGSVGSGLTGTGTKGTSGRSSSLMPPPTILYVNICRTVMNADPSDPDALDELNDFMPFLRQSLSCLVCARLIQNPMRPPHNHCQHIVCKKCLGGRMRLKPKCSWCRDQSVFIKDSSLKSLVNCYVLMCEYVNSCLNDSLRRASDKRQKGMDSAPVAPLPSFASKDIALMVKEGVDYLSEVGYDEDDDCRHRNGDISDALGNIFGLEETADILMAAAGDADAMEKALSGIEKENGSPDLKVSSETRQKGDETKHQEFEGFVEPVESKAQPDGVEEISESETTMRRKSRSLSTSSSSSFSATTSTVGNRPTTPISATNSTVGLATVKLSNLDSEDVQSNDEFHDAVEVVDDEEEKGKTEAKSMVIEDIDRVVDVKSESVTDDAIRDDQGASKQPLVCELTETVESAFQVVVESNEETPVELPAQVATSSVHNYSLPPEYDTTVAASLASGSPTLKRKSSVDVFLASNCERKPSAAVKKIQLVSYPDAAVSIASSGFATSVSSVEDVIAVQGKPKRVVARIGVPTNVLPKRANYIPVPTHPSLPHSTQVRRLPPAGKQRTSTKTRASKKAGCRCGMATQTPGQLTCCGQRCPCYVSGYQCVDCRCRGCRNPYDEHGNKRELSIHDILQRQSSSNTANTTVKTSSSSPDVVVLGKSGGIPISMGSTFVEAPATLHHQQLRNNRGSSSSGGPSIVTVTTIPAYSSFSS